MSKHYFKEKAFDVGLCLLHRTDGGIDYMVLRVYDNGLLTAERKFKQYVDAGERTLNALEYKDTEITYTDADPERNVPPKENHLTMPPTTWDWFTANYLPF